MEATNVYGNQGISKAMGPFPTSSLVFNNLPEISLTPASVTNLGTLFTGFTVGKTYRFRMQVVIQHTTLSQNRVVRLAFNKALTATPQVSDPFIGTSITTIFGQGSAFGNVAWSPTLEVVWIATGDAFGIWPSHEIDGGTVTVGGFFDECRAKLIIETL
jgi:hypothetical protein